MSAHVMAATQRPIDLRWEAPPGCPQEGDVRSRIQKLLGTERHDSPLRAEGTITRIDGRFQLELVVHVGEVAGTRGLAAKSCDDLAGAAAVEIALLVHSVEASAPEQSSTPPTTLPPSVAPEASGPGSAGTSGPSPGTSGSSSGTGGPSSGATGSSSQGTNTATPAAPAADDRRREPSTEDDRAEPEQPLRAETPRRWHALVQGPVGALGVGPLPPPAVGFGLSVGLEYVRWQVQVQGLAWRRQNAPAQGFPGYGVDVDRLAASLWICRESRFDGFGLSPCIVAGVERVSMSGTGNHIVPATQRAMGASVGAGLQGRIPLTGWIRLLATVGAEILLVRPQLLLDQLGPLAPPPDGEPPDPPTPIYRFAPAALTATLSLEWVL